MTRTNALRRTAIRRTEMAHTERVYTIGAGLSALTRPTTLAQARELVAEDDHEKWDALEPRRQLALKDGLLALPAEDFRLTLSRHAQSQLCSRLGIPSAYFAACPPILQDVQANYWLKEAAKPGETWLVRAKGGMGRAVLSDKYSPLDNAALLDTLLPLLDKDRYVPDWFSLAEDALHLRIVDRSRATEVRPGDELSIGVHIRNSEVGASSLTLDALVYRLVCSNGLIALVQGKSLLQQRHVHLCQPRFVAALEEAIHQAFQAAESFRYDFWKTLEQPVPDPLETLEAIAPAWQWGAETHQRAKEALEREDAQVQHTAYGIINAMTQAAQTLPDEKRYKLEALAGHYVSYGIPAHALGDLARGQGADEDGGAVEETGETNYEDKSLILAGGAR